MLGGILGDFANAFTGLCILYLLWLGWDVFVRQKGDPGTLALTFGGLAILEVLNAVTGIF